MFEFSLGVSGGLYAFASLFKLFMYLAALGLNCSKGDLRCIMQDLLLQGRNSLVLVCRFSLLCSTWGS